MRAAALAARRIDAGRRALPDFLVIGAQRSGTTALYADLVADPGVLPALRKEVHFFDLNAHRGERWYRAFFPTRARLARSGAITGEATPYYLFHPTAPARARATVPDARLVVILRDPVERAFSHWRHNRRRGVEPLGFDAALAAETDRLAGQDTVVATDGGTSLAHRRWSYTARGRYAEQLGRWWAHFPRSQTVVVPSERLFGGDPAPRQAIRQLLGLPADEPLPPMPAPNRTDPEPIDPATRARLEAVFAEPNRALFELLGDDLGWRG